MAWDYYLNLEPITLKAARDAVSKTSVTNVDQLHSDFYDESVFYENLQHGYTAVVMAVSFFESSVNTIMGHIYGYGISAREIRFSILDKLDLIMVDHIEEWVKIKGSRYWQQYKELEKVRMA